MYIAGGQGRWVGKTVSGQLQVQALDWPCKCSRLQQRCITVALNCYIKDKRNECKKQYYTMVQQAA